MSPTPSRPGASCRAASVRKPARRRGGRGRSRGALWTTLARVPARLSHAARRLARALVGALSHDGHFIIYAPCCRAASRRGHVLPHAAPLHRLRAATPSAARLLRASRPDRRPRFRGVLAHRGHGCSSRCSLRRMCRAVLYLWWPSPTGEYTRPLLRSDRFLPRGAARRRLADRLVASATRWGRSRCRRRARVVATPRSSRRLWAAIGP